MVQYRSAKCEVCPVGMILWKRSLQQSKYITRCDLMWYPDCQRQSRESLVSLTANPTAHRPHRWVMWVSTLLSELTKSERKSTVLLSMESRDIFHNSKVTPLMRQEILPKVCSAAWIRLMKHESELVHAHTDREGAEWRELVLLLSLIIQGITPGESLIIQIFKSGTIKTWTFPSEH